MTASKLRFVAVVSAMVLLSTAAARAEVWGVKTNAPVSGASGPPSNLFYFDESGGGLVGVGVVTLGGGQIDVDALAMDAGGGLYGFQVNAAGSSSHLLAIDTSSAVATAVGSSLSNRDIRGAVFAADGRLLALDANRNELVVINPSTGGVVGSGIALAVGVTPQDVQTITDIAQELDGGLVMTGAGNTLYSLNAATGQLVLLHADTVVQADGAVPAFAGLAFSTDAPDANTLFTFDVNHVTFHPSATIASGSEGSVPVWT